MVYILTSLLFGFSLSYFIIQKRKKNKPNSSFIFKIFTLFWTSVLCLLLFFLVPEVVHNSYAYLIYPKYEAVIVDIRSERELISNFNEGNKSRILMHTPIVKFKLENSSTYTEMSLNIKSTEKPKLGNTIKVAYQNQSIYQLTKKGYLFLFGEILLILMFFYPLLHSVFYITGKDTKKLKTIAVRGAVYIAVVVMIIFVIVVFRAMF